MDVFRIALLACCPCSLAAQTVEKVSAPLATDPTQGGGLVTALEFGSQGTRVFFAADLAGTSAGELWSVPFAGGPIARLSAFERAVREPNVRVRSAPGRRRAVFWTDPVASGVMELFVVPDDGSAPPQRLHPPYTSGQEAGQDFAIAGDAVFFRSNQRLSGRFELFRAPLDASTPPVPISGSLVAGGSLGSSAFQDQLFELTPAGDRAVYLADARIDNRTELFSVPSDGSSAPLRLSANLVQGGQVRQFVLTPDGARVLYVADQEAVARLELYSVATTGGAVTRVSAPPVTGGGLWFQKPVVSSDGARVLYLADALTDGEVELFSAPIDGSAAPVRLNAPMPHQGFVTTFRASPDGARVVYLADQERDEEYDLWVAPVDGSAAPVRLLGAAFAGVRGQVALGLSSSRALCLADVDADGTSELYSAPLDASAAPVRLSNAVTTVGTAVAEVSPDGTRAWFLQLGAQNRVELFGVPLDGSVPAQRLSPPLPPGGRVLLPRFRADGAVAFLCDARALGQFSVWSHAGGAPRELTPALPPAPTVGDVSAYAWAPGATHILYGADRFQDRMGTVTSVSLRSGTESYTDPADGTIFELFFPPQGTHFACTRFTVGDFFPFPANTALHVAPLERADESVHVVGSTGLGPVLFPDREHAVVGLYSSGFRIDPLGSLVLARLDGSLPSRVLSPPLERPSSVGPVVLAPRAARAVFAVQSFGAQPLFGLYSAHLERDEPAQRLDLAAHDQPAVLSLQLRARDELALFVADLAELGRRELWAVPADGSRPPRRLHAALPSGTEVRPEFRLSPDGEHVVFASDARLDGAFELYAARVDDGTTVALSGALVAGGDILASGDPEPNFWLSPDGARVVYLADQAVDEVVEYWSVPLDASAPPVRLHAPLAGALDAVPAAHFSPDGTRVVLPLELVNDGQVELVVAPVDGHTSPTVLSAPFPPGGGLKTLSQFGTRGTLALAPGGRHAFYLAEQDVDGVVELYSVPLDASRAPLRWNAPLVSGGNVVSFALRPTPGAVLYLADQDEDETFELYLASFPDAPPARAASAAPTGSATLTLPD